MCLLLDALVSELLKVGLVLNAKKTKALTTMAQAPAAIHTPEGLTIDVINRESAHKWLGCMLSTGGAETRTLDLNYHMQGAAKAFYANRRILCDKRASIAQRLQLFNSVVMTVAFFAAEHRPMYVEDLRAMDIEFRRLVRQIVGPPPQVSWAACWGSPARGAGGCGRLLGRPAGDQAACWEARLAVLVAPWVAGGRARAILQYCPGAGVAVHASFRRVDLLGEAGSAEVHLCVWAINVFCL